MNYIKKTELINWLRNNNYTATDFFTRTWGGSSLVLWKSANDINYIIVDFENKEWAYR